MEVRTERVFTEVDTILKVVTDETVTSPDASPGPGLVNEDP